MDATRLAVISLALVTFTNSAIHTVYAQSDEGFRFRGSEARSNPYGGIGGIALYGVVASVIVVATYTLVHVSINLLKGYNTRPTKDGTVKKTFKRDMQ